MAFWGCDFTFNGIKASSKGLMLYDFGANIQDDADFSVGEIVEDRIIRRFDSLLYGLVQNEPLVFTLVFGAEADMLNDKEYLSRDKIDEIASWLTGYDTWQELIIDQDDMSVTDPNSGQITGGYKYKCMITGLRLLTDGMYPWAFTCQVTCDSPFAYHVQGIDFTSNMYSSGGGYRFDINNTSSYKGFLYPVITITSAVPYNGNISLANLDDTINHTARASTFTDIPNETQTIVIDCKNQIITSSKGYNLYPYFNFKFLRIKPGTNRFYYTGQGQINISCDLPANIGA